MLKVNNKNTRKTSLSRSGTFIVIFEHISRLFLLLLLLTLNKEMLAGYWVSELPQKSAENGCLIVVIMIHILLHCYWTLYQHTLICSKSTINSRKRCEICSKLTIKTPEQRQRSQWRCSGVFVVNLELISHLF